MQFDSRTSILSPSGAQVNLYRTSPSAAPTAVVQINHGLAEHAARYHRFARYLAEQGIATYAHDHRGHGLTSAPGAPLGSFGPPRTGIDPVIADVMAVHDVIATEHPGVPVVVLGHSMGALIAMNVTARHSSRIAGAAIWNGNFGTAWARRLGRTLLAWERFRIGSDVPSRILPKETFRTWARKVTDGRTSFDWLSRDHAEVDQYVADPRCGWDASVGMWLCIFDLMEAGSDPRNFANVRRDLPFSLVGGASDPATDLGKAVEMTARSLSEMGFSNLVSTIYPQTRHESLNELNRDVIMSDFVHWIRSKVLVSGPSPSA